MTRFWDDFGPTGLGIVAIIFGAIALVFAAYYFTGYQADLGNCHGAGGHYVGGPLGGCVYPHGDTTRVHLNGGSR